MKVPLGGELTSETGLLLRNSPTKTECRHNRLVGELGLKLGVEPERALRGRPHAR